VCRALPSATPPCRPTLDEWPSTPAAFDPPSPWAISTLIERAEFASRWPVVAVLREPGQARPASRLSNGL